MGLQDVESGGEVCKKEPGECVGKLQMFVNGVDDEGFGIINTFMPLISKQEWVEL